MSQRPSGIICTADELAASNSLSTSSTLHCFTRGDSLGLMITTEAAIVSLISVSYVFLRILWNIRRVYFIRENRRQRLRLIHHPVDVLMLSLFTADILQAIGGALNAKWVNDGKVEVGTYCNAQGIIANIGETGVALFNLTISVYTFLGLWLRKDISSIRLTVCVITCIWLFIAIIVAVGNATHHDPAFLSPTPYWCWISKQYLVWRIVAEYLWFWIALLLSLLVYIPVLWLRKDTPGDKWRESLILLAYPLTYCLSVLPLSVTRWIGFLQEAKYNRNDIPPAATFASITMFTLSGFFNVVLLLNTKPNSGLFGHLVSVSPRRPPDRTSSSMPQTDQHRAELQTEARQLYLDGPGILPRHSIS